MSIKGGHRGISWPSRSAVKAETSQMEGGLVMEWHGICCPYSTLPVYVLLGLSLGLARVI
eukprot:6197873-Pleurochrysis_carterae.AAC.6